MQQKPKQNRDHMGRVAGLCCVLTSSHGRECRGRTTVQHLQGAKYRGLGQKSSDFLTIPLCEAHHLFGPNSIEHMGKGPWEAKYGTQDFLYEVTQHMLRHVYPDVYGASQPPHSQHQTNL